MVDLFAFFNLFSSKLNFSKSGFSVSISIFLFSRTPSMSLFYILTLWANFKISSLYCPISSNLFRRFLSLTLSMVFKITMTMLKINMSIMMPKYVYPYGCFCSGDSQFEKMNKWYRRQMNKNSEKDSVIIALKVTYGEIDPYHIR